MLYSYVYFSIQDIADDSKKLLKIVRYTCMHGRRIGDDLKDQSVNNKLI